MVTIGTWFPNRGTHVSMMSVSLPGWQCQPALPAHGSAQHRAWRPHNDCFQMVECFCLLLLGKNVEGMDSLLVLYRYNAAISDTRRWMAFSCSTGTVIMQSFQTLGELLYSAKEQAQLEEQFAREQHSCSCLSMQGNIMCR